MPPQQQQQPCNLQKNTRGDFHHKNAVPVKIIRQARVEATGYTPDDDEDKEEVDDDDEDKEEVDDEDEVEEEVDDEDEVEEVDDEVEEVDDEVEEVDDEVEEEDDEVEEEYDEVEEEDDEVEEEDDEVEEEDDEQRYVYERLRRETNAVADTADVPMPASPPGCARSGEWHRRRIHSGSRMTG
ncbi:hypothetical protein MRX96_003535 [Rhipicephalus microplus]